MKIGEGGYLVLDDGVTRVKDAEGKDIQVQELFDSALNSRMGKERTAKEKAEARIAELQAELDKAVKPEIKGQLEARIEELTAQLETKEEAMARQVKKQIETLTGERDNAIKAHQAMESRFYGAQLATMISDAAVKNKFKKPEYLRMALAGKESWEDELDPATAKATGNKVARFKLTVPTADGKGMEDKVLDIQEAAAAIAKMEPDFILGSNSQGTGNQGHPAASGGQPTGLEAIYKTS